MTNSTKFDQSIIEKLLLIIVLTSLIFGQMLRLPLSLKSVLYLHDLAIIIFLLLNFKLILGALKPSAIQLFVKRRPLESLMIGWTLLSLLLTLVVSEQVIPLLYFLRLLALGAFVILIFYKQSTLQLLQLHPFLITGLTILALGLLQITFLPDTRFLAILGWDDHFYRLIGTWFDPNFMGMLIVLTSLSLLAFLEKRQTTISSLLMLSPIIFALCLTFSRASYLSFTLAILAIILQQLLRQRHWTHLITLSLSCFLIFASIMIVVPKPQGEGGNLLRTASIESRISTDYREATTLRQQPLVGNQLFLKSVEAPKIEGMSNHANLPNNIFVLVATGAGLVGLFIFTALTFKWGVELFQLNVFAFASYLAMMIHTQFNNTLLNSFIFLMFAGLLGEILVIGFKKSRVES